MMPTTSPRRTSKDTSPERPELVPVALPEVGEQHVLEAVLRVIVQAVDLAHRAYGHHDLIGDARLAHRYITSAKPFFVCMNHA